MLKILLNYWKSRHFLTRNRFKTSSFKRNKEQAKYSSKKCKKRLKKTKKFRKKLENSKNLI